MKHGRLPDFTEFGELVEIADDSVSDTQSETAFARYMSDAMFLIPTPQVLQKIITGLDDLYEHDIADLDMQGDLYEYMLGKLATAGQNGQFRTPKHIREMMVELLRPTRTIPSATRPAARRDFWSLLRNTSEGITRYHDQRTVGAFCWGRLYRV